MQDNETYLEAEERLGKGRAEIYTRVKRDRKRRGIPMEGWKRWREEQAQTESK